MVVIVRGGTLLGLVGLQDTPRPGTKRLIEKLRERGLKTVMLTGDACRVAEAIGQTLMMDEVRAELLPREKVEAIEALQREGRKVAMVVDGMSDAPALAQGEVGI